MVALRSFQLQNRSKRNSSACFRNPRQLFAVITGNPYYLPIVVTNAKISMPWQKYHPPAEAADILANCKGLTIASTTDELIDLACGGERSNSFVVNYEIPGNGNGDRGDGLLAPEMEWLPITPSHTCGGAIRIAW